MYGLINEESPQYGRMGREFGILYIFCTAGSCLMFFFSMGTASKNNLRRNFGLIHIHMEIWPNPNENLFYFSSDLIIG